MKQLITLAMKVSLVAALVFSVCFALVKLGQLKPARPDNPPVQKLSDPPKKKAQPKKTNRQKANKTRIKRNRSNSE